MASNLRSNRPRSRLLLAVALLALPAAAFAQKPNPEEVVSKEVAPVTLDGRTLFSVVGVDAISPKARADGIARRIAAAAADPKISPESVQVLEQQGYFMLKSGDLRLMVVGEWDAAQSDLGAKAIADIRRETIAAAILQYRKDRQPDVLLRAAGYAAFATLLLLAALWVLHRASGIASRRVETAWKAAVDRNKKQALQLLQLDRMHSALRSGLFAIRAILFIGCFVIYFQYTLGLFPRTRAASQGILSVLLEPLNTIAKGVIESIPSLVFLLVLAIVVRYVLKLAKAGFDGLEHGSVHVHEFEPEWAQPTFRIVRVAIIGFALVVAYPYLPGSQTEAFKGISIFAGLVFSLGSSSALANIIAGYSLTYRRAFRVGDRIRIGADIGDVTAVRLQVTHLRSLKNEEIIIPNSNILNNNVINYSRLAKEQGLILHTKVGIGYETPWRQVEAMLLAAAERTSGLLHEPKPFVLHKELGDFAVTYELNVYCNDAQAGFRRYTDLHRNILDVFNEYGVQIMTPNYESDPKQPKWVPKNQWYLEPAAPPEKPASNGPSPR